MAYATIDNPLQYFNTVLYTGDIVDGDGTGHDQAITGVGFQPDWVWHKGRSHARTHIWADSVRGTGGSPTQMLGISSQDSGVETNSNTNGWIESLDSDGFTVTSGNDSSSKSNNSGANGNTYVAWNWKAGGSASSNSNGSITSSVSASTDAGFSIVSYTGTGSNATVGHGLGVAPKMMIFKNRSAAQPWCVYHDGLSSSSHSLHLDETSAEQNLSPNPFNTSAPTSTIINLGGQDMVNKSSDNHIAYCFADVKGYSKFGSYTGNGNNDGIFIYTGFKPAWFLIKSSSNAEQWEMVDNKRNTINPLNLLLYPDQGVAEFTGSTGDRLHCDFTANGVKLRGNASSANGNGLTYIYMCLAESPFVNSNKVPNNAR